MAQIKTSNSYSYSTLQYSNFNGVDFNPDPSLVNKTRSPDGLNMISDEGGNPIKRKGWEIFKTLGANAIDNIWSYNTTAGETIVALSGGSLYFCPTDGRTPTSVALGITAGKHCAVNTDKGLLVFGDTELYMCDTSMNVVKLAKGATLTDGSKFEPYVPTVLVGCNPTGGGTMNEPINLMTRERIETFFPDGSSKSFTVSSVVDTSKSYTIYANGIEQSQVSVSGSTFTLTGAPAKSDYATVTIQYFAIDGGLSTVNKRKVASAVQVQNFADGASHRWFAINEDSNIVRYSELNDYTYWGDLNYVVVGSAKHKLQGFLPINSYLGVVKEKSDSESTLFFIDQTTVTDSTSTVDSNYNVDTTSSSRTVYKVTPAAAGVGAISHQSFSVLNDEPVFLSDQGVHGVATVSTTSDKSLRSRSGYINGKLLKESNLENAVSCVYDGYYMLALNNHMYILDGRQETSDPSGNTNFNYEGYYWENIPANCLLPLDQLYFGTSDGNICRFKNSGDNADYSDNDTAIKAVWSTKNDNAGYPQYYKDLQKKGSSVTVSPFTQTSVDVYYEADNAARVLIGSKSFTDTGAKIDYNKYITKKIKKYMALKIIAENDKIEPFGVTGITLTFILKKYAK